MAKFGADHFLFDCFCDLLIASKKTAEAVVQQKQEVMLTLLSLAIFKCSQKFNVIWMQSLNKFNLYPTDH